MLYHSSCLQGICTCAIVLEHKNRSCVPARGVREGNDKRRSPRTTFVGGDVGENRSRSTDGTYRTGWCATVASSCAIGRDRETAPEIAGFVGEIRGSERPVRRQKFARTVRIEKRAIFLVALPDCPVAHRSDFIRRARKTVSPGPIFLIFLGGFLPLKTPAVPAALPPGNIAPLLLTRRRTIVVVHYNLGIKNRSMRVDLYSTICRLCCNESIMGHVGKN